MERLRAAEKFMKKGTGEGECQGCGYSYTPKEGDDEYPVPKGTRFEVGFISIYRSYDTPNFSYNTPKEGNDEYPMPKGTCFEVGHARRQRSMSPILSMAADGRQQQLWGAQMWRKLWLHADYCGGRCVCRSHTCFHGTT